MPHPRPFWTKQEEALVTAYKKGLLRNWRVAAKKIRALSGRKVTDNAFYGKVKRMRDGARDDD